MPFIPEEQRANPNSTLPGPRCYVEYKRMMDTWRETPRWTTIDRIAKVLYPDDNLRAYFLAFLVFMAFHGYRYEEEKRNENGDI